MVSWVRWFYETPMYRNLRSYFLNNLQAGVLTTIFHARKGHEIIQLTDRYIWKKIRNKLDFAGVAFPKKMEVDDTGMENKKLKSCTKE